MTIIAGNKGNFLEVNVDGSVKVRMADSMVVESGTASAGTNDTLTDNTKTWVHDAYQGSVVLITNGTGKGQVRQIASNNGTALTVSPNWDTNPDATSQYEIRDRETQGIDITHVGGDAVTGGAINAQLTGSIAAEDEQLTVTNAVQILTVATYGDATKALITVETADIRFRLTGTDPTATEGHLLKAGESLVLTSADDIANFKAFRDAGTDATIYVTYS